VRLLILKDGGLVLVHDDAAATSRSTASR